MSLLFLPFGPITIPVLASMLSGAWPSSIVGMCHCTTTAVGDETHCCGLKTCSSSGVGGGEGGGCWIALPVDCNN